MTRISWPKKRGVLCALTSAALFGVSTPCAKLLLGQIPAGCLAGLFYLGSGIGLAIWWLCRRRFTAGEVSLSKGDLPWLAAAIFFGGVLGPLALMWGLARTPASTSALLLNLEGVFTALLAWYVFKENFDRRIAFGLALIVAGGLILSWQGLPQGASLLGPLAVALACAAWAFDNNFTRKISCSDPVQIAALKGLVSGAMNLSLAFALHEHFPTAALALAAGGVGFVGYGLSLVLFILGLRHLGSARTGAYFSVAPFMGAAASLLLWPEQLTPALAAAGACMAAGVWLHLSEAHSHEHTHQAEEHEHRHTHDEHHQHAHEDETDLSKPHSHWHTHGVLRHAHPHYPDILHRHGHSQKK